MSKLIIRFLAVVLGLFVVSEVVSGISISGLYAAIVVAVFLGIMNILVRPILVILTLPVTVLTLGFFIFIINASIFLFIGSIVKGFEVDNFIAAFLGSVIVSSISWFIQKIT